MAKTKYTININIYTLPDGITKNVDKNNVFFNTYLDYFTIYIKNRTDNNYDNIYKCWSAISSFYTLKDTNKYIYKDTSKRPSFRTITKIKQTINLPDAEFNENYLLNDVTYKLAASDYFFVCKANSNNISDERKNASVINSNLLDKKFDASNDNTEITFNIYRLYIGKPATIIINIYTLPDGITKNVDKNNEFFNNYLLSLTKTANGEIIKSKDLYNEIKSKWSAISSFYTLKDTNKYTYISTDKSPSFTKITNIKKEENLPDAEFNEQYQQSIDNLFYGYYLSKVDRFFVCDEGTNNLDSKNVCLITAKNLLNKVYTVKSNKVRIFNFYRLYGRISVKTNKYSSETVEDEQTGYKLVEESISNYDTHGLALTDTINLDDFITVVQNAGDAYLYHHDNDLKDNPILSSLYGQYITTLNSSNTFKLCADTSFNYGLGYLAFSYYKRVEKYCKENKIGFCGKVSKYLSNYIQPELANTQINNGFKEWPCSISEVATKSNQLINNFKNIYKSKNKKPIAKQDIIDFLQSYFCNLNRICQQQCLTALTEDNQLKDKSSVMKSSVMKSSAKIKITFYDADPKTGDKLDEPLGDPIEIDAGTKPIASSEIQDAQSKYTVQLSKDSKGNYVFNGWSPKTSEVANKDIDIVAMYIDKDDIDDDEVNSDDPIIDIYTCSINSTNKQCAIYTGLSTLYIQEDKYKELTNDKLTKLFNKDKIIKVQTILDAIDWLIKYNKTCERRIVYTITEKNQNIMKYKVATNAVRSWRLITVYDWNSYKNTCDNKIGPCCRTFFDKDDGYGKAGYAFKGFSVDCGFFQIWYGKTVVTETNIEFTSTNEQIYPDI